MCEVMKMAELVRKPSHSSKRKHTSRKQTAHKLVEPTHESRKPKPGAKDVADSELDSECDRDFNKYDAEIIQKEDLMLEINAEEKRENDDSTLGLSEILEEAEIKSNLVVLFDAVPSVLTAGVEDGQAEVKDRADPLATFSVHERTEHEEPVATLSVVEDGEEQPDRAVGEREPSFEALFNAEKENEAKEDQDDVDGGERGDEVLDLIGDVHHRLEPMPLVELLALHQNTALERNDFYVSSFVASQARVDREPLYDLLSAYSSARTRLIAASARVRALRDEARRIETQAWSAETVRAVVEDECADGAKVYGVKDYALATFDVEKGRLALPSSLRNLRMQLYETHALHGHSAMVARLRIDAHVDRIIEACGEFLPSCEELPQSTSAPSCPAASDEELNRLRSAISVLFSFVRCKHKDETFVQDIRTWLDRLVAVLLGIADRSDHLFLLNHCLRCPAGHGKWAARYVVVPPVVPVDPSRVVTPAVDHVVVVLATVLSSPVAARDRFLASYISNVGKGDGNDGDSPVGEGEEKWTFLDDEDDDESAADRDPVEFLESDLLAILARIPFYDILRQLLGVVGSDAGGTCNAVVLPADSDNFMKVLAVASKLCEIFHAGLVTYSRPKYRNLGKLLCRFLAHLALFVGDQFEALCSDRGRGLSRRLQAEYDAFIERVFLAIRSARHFGSWQFLSQLSYKMVSLGQLMELKTIALCVRFPLPAREVLDEKGCDGDGKTESGVQVNGLDELVGMLSESDSFYIMAAVVKMATSRPSQCGGERRFLTSVVLDILKVGFLDAEHQDVQSKPCRDLLASLSQHHPTALSIVLREVIRNVSAMGKLSLYLVRDLPWNLWRPEPEDVELLTHCLVHTHAQSLDSQCARAVISELNLGTDASGEALFLARDVHRRIAAAVVAAHGLHASSAGPGFDAWAWNTARGLKLHALHQPGKPLTSVFEGDRSHFDAVPELSGCSGQDWLVAIRKGVEANEPMAFLIAVLSTEIGHSVPLLLSKGFTYLRDMSELGTSPAAKECLIFALDAVLPLFYSCPSELATCQPLLTFTLSMLTTDASYLNMAKGLVFPSAPGPTTMLLQMAIRREIFHARSSIPGDGPTAAILVWFEILTSCCQSWWTNPNVLRLMDTICEGALCCDAAWKVWEVITGKLIKLQRDQPPQKLGKSAQLLNWVRPSSGSSPPPLTPKWPLPEYPWYALAALRAWARWEEEDSGLYLALCRELVGDTCLSLETALKRACQLSGSLPKAGVSVTLGSLSIYRWMQQAVACCSQLPASVCPSLPFVVQEFYSKYFFRVPAPSDFGTSEFASIGFKFFEDANNFSALKHLKKRLNDAKVCAEKKATTGSSFDDDDFEAVVLKDVKHWKSVSAVLDAATLWLEERSLHEIQVYLESLPPRYLAEKLESLFQGDKTPWYACLDAENFEWVLDKNDRDWGIRFGHRGPEPRRSTPRSNSSRQLSAARSNGSGHRSSASPGGESGRGSTVDGCDEEPTSRILSRFQDAVLDFTRTARVMNPNFSAVMRERKVGEITSFSQGLLSSPASVATVVEPRIRTLAEIAQFNAKRSAEHVGLDANFVEDLLPKLYESVEKTATVVATCRDEIPAGVVTGATGVGSSLRGLASAVKLRHPYGHAPPPCRGPVHMKIKYAESRINESIGYQISQNRRDWDIMIRQALEPPVEDALQAAFILTELVSSLCDTKDNPWADRHFAQSGLTVFYILVDGMTQDLEGFPPTRQLFSCLVEKLGQTFVNCRVEESPRLLDRILAKPTLLGLLAPHWAMISSAPPDVFVPVYRRVVLDAFSYDDFPDLPFVLLSKCDLKTWLPRTKPPLGAIDDLIEAQMSSLTDEPKGQGADANRGPAYALVRRHFRHCVAWNFPASFPRTLDRMLTASRGWETPAGLWHEFLAALLAANQVRGPPGGMDVGIESWAVVWRNFAQQQVGMSLPLLVDTMRRLAKRMEEDRTGGMSTYGLYSMYRNYVKPLACLFGLLSNAFVISSLQADAGSLSEPLLKSMWQEILALFRYWIMPTTLPYALDASGGNGKDGQSQAGAPSLPWVPADAPLADSMLASFVGAISLLHETVPATHSALSILWEWYVQTFANGYTKAHIFAAVHARLTTLPWRSFWPGYRDVELMTKLLDSYLPDCHGFLGSVFVRVCWTEVLGAALDQPIVRVPSGMGVHVSGRHRGNPFALVCDYFGLLVKLAREPSVRQSEFLWPLLTQADQFPLSQAVDHASFEKLVQWFLLSCDPKIVLDVSERDIIDLQTYRLLEAASGIYSKRASSNTQSLGSKCRLFVRLYVRLLLSCQNKFKAMFASRGIAVRDSVRRVAGLIERRIGDLETAAGDALLDELLVVVVKLDTSASCKGNGSSNSHGGSEHVNAVEQGLLEWISTMSWHTSGTLRAVISSLGRLVGMGGGATGGHWREDAAAFVGRLTEAALAACFRESLPASGLEAEAVPELWDEVSKTLWSGVGSPGATFWHISAKEGCLLVLYSLCRFRRKSSSVSCFDVARDCVAWAEEAKNSLSMEPKFFLLWDQCFDALASWRAQEQSDWEELQPETSRKGSDDSGDAVRRAAQERDVLCRLTALTMALSEERAGGGFLGAIGLGRRSQFSVEFRFSCACLAAALMVFRARTNSLDYSEAHHHGQKKLHSVDGWRPVLLDKGYAVHAETAHFVLDYISGPPPVQPDAVVFADGTRRMSVESFSEIREREEGSVPNESAGPFLCPRLRRSFMRRVTCGLFPTAYLADVLNSSGSNSRVLGDSD